MVDAIEVDQRCRCGDGVNEEIARRQISMGTASLFKGMDRRGQMSKQLQPDSIIEGDFPRADVIGD
jgi:hypothetical protein